MDFVLGEDVLEVSNNISIRLLVGVVSRDRVIANEVDMKQFETVW